LISNQFVFEMEHHPILLVQGAHKILHFGSKCGWLGVEFQQVTPDIADRLRLEKVKGALISEVKPRSPAARAGIRSGDIVTAINGEDIENAIRSHSMRAPQIVLLPGDMTFRHQRRQEPVREDQCGALAMHAGPLHYHAAEDRLC
jgi:membrane-associated protease RseP (regulator of RpoE activity)